MPSRVSDHTAYCATCRGVRQILTDRTWNGSTITTCYTCGRSWTSAGAEGRTRTAQGPQDFESRASTSSATPANKEAIKVAFIDDASLLVDTLRTPLRRKPSK